MPADGRPQVAVAGRSNVGKSSLINLLLNRRSLARTSSRPGHTRLVNFFLVNEFFYLTDLPGYGYAVVDRHTRAAWGELVGGYLAQAGTLKLVLLLFDCRRGLGDEDRQLIDWLAAAGIPWQAVLTKSDKLRAAALATARRRWEAVLREAGSCLPPICFSVPRRRGREDLLDVIERHLADAAPPVAAES
ncbi:MAG: YihA family ribosome biogenesis GTP-binding protein [Deltaproteobacteria bacterium]|nr:YihA family ribosome biogenesis GTP-binding protein [Candidatus Anaeroferrophillacea bacterium]